MSLQTEDQAHPLISSILSPAEAVVLQRRIARWSRHALEEHGLIEVGTLEELAGSDWFDPRLHWAASSRLVPSDELLAENGAFGSWQETPPISHFALCAAPSGFDRLDEELASAHGVEFVASKGSSASITGCVNAFDIAIRDITEISPSIAMETARLVRAVAWGESDPSLCEAVARAIGLIVLTPAVTESPLRMQMGIVATGAQLSHDVRQLFGSWTASPTRLLPHPESEEVVSSALLVRELFSLLRLSAFLGQSGRVSDERALTADRLRAFANGPGMASVEFTSVGSVVIAEAVAHAELDSSAASHLRTNLDNQGVVK